MCISPDQEPLTERRQYSGLEGARIDAWVWACKVGGGGCRFIRWGGLLGLGKCIVAGCLNLNESKDAGGGFVGGQRGDA